VAFPLSLKDQQGVPIAQVYLPGLGFYALQGAVQNTDGSGNPYAALAINDPNIGGVGDPVWSGSGSGSAIAILKKIVAGQAGPASVTQGSGAAAGTFWRVAGDFSEQAGLSAGALNADLVPATDVSGFKFWSLQVATVATGGVLTFQWSNDNVTYNTLTAFRLENLNQNNAGSSTSTANSLFGGPIYFRYLRVRQSAWTSGSSTGTLELYTVPPPLTFLTSVQTLAAATLGGSNNFHLVSAATTNATNIKASSGTLYGYEIFNAAAAVRFVKLFNKATAPTPGTDTPFRTIGIPAGGTKNFNSDIGIAMGTGIGVATTTGIADLDNTAVAAADLVIDIAWK
jgi:hypothetical protein